MKAEAYHPTGRTGGAIARYLVKGTREEWDTLLRQLDPDGNTEHFYLWQHIEPHVVGHPRRKIQVWMEPQDATVLFPLARIPHPPG